MYLKEIEHLLKNDTRFDISQTFGLAKKQDFEFGFVADTFDKLMFQDTVIPSLATFENTILMQFKALIKEQNVPGEEVHGRIARMWAGFVMEQHAYQLLLQTGNEYGFKDTTIISNPELDMKKGIDVYLKNTYNLSDSGKLRIYKDSAQKWRDLKDKKRPKGNDVLGITENVPVGKDTPEHTKEINRWYLLSDNHAHKLIKKYLPVITRSMILENFLGFQK
tara:strand:+ start:572 stop:1234 length:663 start_codon:yes stop_codon:yes gene_type:complete